MPDDPDAQDEAVLNIFFTNVAHLKCDDGTYYLVCTDALVPHKGTTAEMLPPGSEEFKKALVLREKGVYNPEDDNKPTLRVIK